MSRIDDLISKYCPNGVEFKNLIEITVSLPKGTLKKDELDANGVYPVMNGGKDYYGYYNEYNNEGNVIVIASRGNAGYVSYLDTKFWAGGLCYPYTSRDEQEVNTKYLYYYLKQQEKTIMDTLVSKGSIPALNKSDIDKFQVPVPPLPVQEEIVKTLDSFTMLETGLEAELEAELEARKKQYEHYRNLLLTPENMVGDVNVVKLGEIAIFSQGTQVVPSLQFSTCDKNQVRFLRIVDFVSDSEPPRYIDKPADKYIKQEGELVMLRYGAAAAGKVFLKHSGAIANNMFKITITTNAITYKYLYHYLSKTAIYNQLNNSNSSTMPAITFTQVKDIEIPIPSLEEQERIVSILDKFDDLVNNISEVLPAEIDVRKQQYEYYRNKLLDFKELPNE